MGDNTFNQYKCADSNYGRVEKCEIPGQFCFTSFTDWDGDKGIRFNFDIIAQMKESIRSFWTKFDKDMEIVWHTAKKRTVNFQIGRSG